jgi:phosphoglycerate dehydrogenase-like enzyme
MPRPRIWYTPPASHTETVFARDDYEALLAEFDVTANEGAQSPAAEEVAARLSEYDALVTGWGSPGLLAGALEGATRLRLIAHSAGSVKFLVTREMIDRYLVPRGVTLFGANSAIAYNVAESTVGMLLMVMHRWPELSSYYRRTGNWKDPAIRSNGQFLSGSTVGIASASAVGREVMRLLEPWPVRILLYDPTLSAEQVEALGAEKVELDELFARSDHISLHLPSIPATDGVVGAEQLALMRPGATLVNTSRGSVLDHDALLEKCKRDEIYVCLDVTTPEPLPRYSEFRLLDNVMITPHVSGAGTYGYHMIGAMTLAALRACFSGQPVRGAVDYTRWELLA